MNKAHANPVQNTNPPTLQGSVKITRPKKIENGVRLYAAVPSESRPWNHIVVYIRTNTMKRWVCDCEDFILRRIGQHRHCRHIRKVRRELSA